MAGARTHKEGNDADLASNIARRREFEKLKRTPGFAAWKRYHYKVQKGRCAWCMRMMNKDYSGVHVDHALALYHGGSNRYSNLVLSHAQCNVEKWIRIDGVPQWILNARRDYGREQRLRVMRKQQRRILTELLAQHEQERLAYNLRWIREEY